MGAQRMPVGRRHLQPHQPARQMCSGVTGLPRENSHSLVSQERRPACGRWAPTFLASRRRHYEQPSTSPSRLWPADVTAIAAGYAHSLFLKNDGSLWAMGTTTGASWRWHLPALPLPTEISQPSRCGQRRSGLPEEASTACFSRATAVCGPWAPSFGQLGDGTTNNIQLPSRLVASGVTALLEEPSTACFLQSDGSLWPWGNSYGSWATALTRLSPPM